MDDHQNASAGPEFSPQPDGDQPADTEEVGEPLSGRIALYLRRCWSRRKLIAGIVAAGIVISVLYSLILPNVYTSTTTLMPPSGATPYADILGTLSPGASESDLATEALGLGTAGDLFVSILESRNVLDGVINRYRLLTYYKTDSLESARKNLAGSTDIWTDAKSGIIGINVTAKSPVLAANLARAYVDELDRVVTENTTSSARRERIFLEGRVKDVKQQLDDSAKQLSEFSSKSGAIDVSSQAKSMIDEGLKLQGDLIEGRSQLAALRQTFSEDNSRVRALEAHNAELQRELDKIGSLPQGAGDSTNEGRSPYPSASQLPALGLTYYDLERKMQVEEALWESLTKEYEAAKVEEAEEIPTVHVLDVANVPERKSAPIRRRIVEVGAAVSLVLAFVIVFLGMIWEEMDPEGEAKRLVADATGALADSRRWYWKLPGLKRIRK